MSQANVELIRRCIETFNHADDEALLDLLDQVAADDTEVSATGRLPDVSGPVVGRDAIKDWFLRLRGTLTYETVADEYIDAGDAVVVVCRQVGRGLGSGAEVSTEMTQVFGMRDGMVTYWDAYRTKREALEALGRRE
jgi:ketosteroid isomerase-like protein